MLLFFRALSRKIILIIKKNSMQMPKALQHNRYKNLTFAPPDFQNLP